MTVHKFNIICLSETYLDSSTAFHNDNLKISDYDLICLDHPSINKCKGVFIYCSFKSLQYKSFGRMYKLWVKIGDKLCLFVAPYRSPSQTQENFCDLYKTLNLPWKIDGK